MDTSQIIFLLLLSEKGVDLPQNPIHSIVAKDPCYSATCALLATDWSREQHCIWKVGRGLVCNMYTWRRVVATMSHHEN